MRLVWLNKHLRIHKLHIRDQNEEMIIEMFRSACDLC